jgi:hypothetical protein
VAYVGFGLFGSAVLAFADVMVRAGSLEYTQGDIDAPIHVAAFVAVLLLAVLGFVGVGLGSVRPNVAVWLLRAAAAGAVLASLNAIVQSHPFVGVALLFFSGLPLALSAWAVGWAEDSGSGRG